MGRMSELGDLLSTAASELEFKPTKKDRELKARFWVRFSEDPFADRETYSKRAMAERLTGAKLTRWDEEGFADWFFNRDEHRHKIEYLFGLSLDAAEEILLNNDPKVQGARVQLIRALSELAGKVPHKQATIQVTNNTAISGAIDSMSKAELELYLSKQGLLASPVEITPSKILLDKEEDK